MYKNYINIKVRLHKNGYYIAYTKYFNRTIYSKSDDLMDCLFQIKAKLNIFYHKTQHLVLYTYLYYDPNDDNYHPLYTDIFNNFIKLF
jgi:hypothetical protein